MDWLELTIIIILAVTAGGAISAWAETRHFQKEETMTEGDGA